MSSFLCSFSSPAHPQQGEYSQNRCSGESRRVLSGVREGAAAGRFRSRLQHFICRGYIGDSRSWLRRHWDRLLRSGTFHQNRLFRGGTCRLLMGAGRESAEERTAQSAECAEGAAAEQSTGEEISEETASKPALCAAKGCGCAKQLSTEEAIQKFAEEVSKEPTGDTVQDRAGQPVCQRANQSTEDRCAKCMMQTADGGGETAGGGGAEQTCGNDPHEQMGRHNEEYRKNAAQGSAEKCPKKCTQQAVCRRPKEQADEGAGKNAGGSAENCIGKDAEQVSDKAEQTGQRQCFGTDGECCKKQAARCAEKCPQEFAEESTRQRIHSRTRKGGKGGGQKNGKRT